MRKKLTTKTVKALKPKEEPYEVVDTELRGFLIRVQPSGVMAYYLSYRNNEGTKKRYWIGPSPTLTPVQARDVAEHLVRRVAGGEDIQATKKATRGQAELRRLRTLRIFLAEKYGPWLETRVRSGAAEIKRIESRFPDFLDKQLDAITPWLVEKWRTARIKQGRTPRTVNRDLASLRSALARAVEWTLISENPLAVVKPLKVDSVGSVRYLTKAEEKLLRKALQTQEVKIRAGRGSGNAWRLERGYPPLPQIGPGFVDHLEPMVLIALNTGMRRGELFNLEWTDVNFRTKTVTVHGYGAKSGQTRHIPLNIEALSVLRQWKKNSSGFVFPNRYGKRFDNINRAWTAIVKAAQVEGFRFHDLRHSFASKLVMAGVDLNTVRELLGHSSIEMTLRYAHLAPEHKAEAVAKLIGS